MSIPRSTARAAEDISKFWRTSVDIASISANTTLDVQVPAPKGFKVGRPVLVFLDPAASALNAGVIVQAVGRALKVAGVLNIEFRVGNLTASPINPAALNLMFIQL